MIINASRQVVKVSLFNTKLILKEKEKKKLNFNFNSFETKEN